MDRPKQAHELMGITSSLGKEMEELYNHWAKIRISDKQVKKLIEITMAPGKEVLASLKEENREALSCHYLNTVDQALEFAFSAPSQLEVTTKGTLFGAYNAVTGYFQNIKGFSSEENKFKSIMSGTAMQRGQKAFDLCLDFTKFGEIRLN